MFEEYKNHDIAVYSGYIDNDEKLLKSASGGIATALSEYIINKGGYVAGVSYTEDFKEAEYIIVNDLKGLEKLKGSKYIDTKKNNIFNAVKDLLGQDELVLFVGVPCIVAAMHKVVGRPDNLITCELICHGPTLPKVHQEYVDNLEKKANSKITDFSVRYKKNYWTPPYLQAKFENGQIFEEEFYHTEYGYAFGMMAKEVCYNCKFKGNNRTGDLMVGDYWGVTKDDKSWNEKGVSIIFAETDKGNSIIKELQTLQRFKLFNSNFEEAVKGNPMVIKSRSKQLNYEKYKKIFTEKGLFYSYKKTVSKKQKVKRIIKNKIPRSLYMKLKKAYQKLK